MIRVQTRTLLHHRLFGVYTAVVVFSLGAVLAPAFVLAGVPGGRHTRRMRGHLFAFGCRAALFLFGVSLKISGPQPQVGERGAMFVSNQCTTLDIAIVAAANPEPFSFVSDARFARVMVIGWVVRRIALIVDREDPISRVQALEAMGASLSCGGSLHVFAEGSRNRGPYLINRLERGAFHAAIQAQRPIHVLTIIDSSKRMSPYALFSMWPGSVTCVWEHPIQTAGKTIDETDDLAQSTHMILLARLRSNYGPETG